MQKKLGKSVLKLVLWDITEQDTDALVNAANAALMWGSWVDGAIHKNWWFEIIDECKKIRDEKYPKWLPTWEAVVTTWWKLQAKYIVHTVGPICRRFLQKNWEDVLLQCYQNVMKIAKEKEIKSISFPSISTWVYGCPIDKTSEIVIKFFKNYLNKENSFKEIRIVLFTQDDFKIYENKFQSILG